MRSPWQATVATLALWVSVAAGCGGLERTALPRASVISLSDPGVRTTEDPTVRGTRLVPESVRDAHPWGAEPGGGIRATVSGVRLVAWADGSIVTATELLPSTPSTVVAVPERMGGGFLFVLGTQLWRSNTWLGEPRPLFRTAAAMGDVLVGLDRAYVWFPPGTLAAFDPRTGVAQDLGPLPPSPRIARIAALDAWRAVVIADFRGAMVTLDAGASWKPLELPIDPSDLVTAADSIVVRGLDAGRRAQWWEIGRDGQAGRLPSAPGVAAATDAFEAVSTDRAARALGASPLEAAIEDGWPLADGTALVARDGLLARVRLADGSVAKVLPDAFSLRPSRCHAISLSSVREPGAFGFVCGEPRGKTVIYRWDGASSGLSELRRFDDPREVLAFGNGALAARGACVPGARDVPRVGEQVWCVMSPGGGWMERVFRGDQVDRARLVVLSDARVALVRPPVAELATGRLTLSDGTNAVHVPLRFPLLHDDATKALLHGIWMDGFEERRPGVLGGWVDASGSVVGVEISLDGGVRVGEYIRDAGAPVASGRWAFGWTASRRAFETTDGGMTWTKGIEVPDPIAPAGAVRERACGPVGCVAAGWLRVGWTPAAPSPSPAPATPLLAAARAARAPPTLRLRCDRLPPETVAVPPVSASPARSGGWQPALVAPGTPLPPFCGKPGPDRPADNPAIVAEIAEAAGWPHRAGPIAAIYAWGPPTGDWDRLGHWQVRWRSAWGGCASSSGATPWTTIDAAARALGRGVGGAPPLALVSGDDLSHALLVIRRSVGVGVVALDAGRAPLEAARLGGDALPDVASAVRAGGHWYVASSQPASQLAAAVLWRLEDGTARELARVPRAVVDAPLSVRLARSSSGRALGVLVEGRPDATRGQAFWVVGVDLETGQAGDPELLAPADLTGGSVSACTGDDAGWQVDWPYSGMAELQSGVAPASHLQTPYLTMRLSRERACLERVVGASGDEIVSSAPAPAVSSRPLGARTIDASIVSSRARTPLRCWLP